MRVSPVADLAVKLERRKRQASAGWKSEWRSWKQNISGLKDRERRLAAQGSNRALDVGGERYGRYGLFRVQPRLVHRLARHSQRGVFPDHRPATDPRHGAPDHGRRDVFPGRKADLEARSSIISIRMRPRCARMVRDPEGRYTITKEIITNPHHPVVMSMRCWRARVGSLQDKVYALLSPHLNGGGEGNSARTVEVAGKRSFMAWRTISRCHGLRLRVSPGELRLCGHERRMAGPAELQDGLGVWVSALNGNIALMGEVNLSHQAAGTRFHDCDRLW